MSAMRKEAVFSIQDLRRVAITCQQCGTQVVLDLARYEPPPERPWPQPPPERREAFTPSQCPACRLRYDSAISALNDLQQAWARLAKLAGVVTFRAFEDEGVK